LNMILLFHSSHFIFYLSHTCINLVIEPYSCNLDTINDWVMKHTHALLYNWLKFSYSIMHTVRLTHIHADKTTLWCCVFYTQGDRHKPSCHISQTDNDQRKYGMTWEKIGVLSILLFVSEILQVFCLSP